MTKKMNALQIFRFAQDDKSVSRELPECTSPSQRFGGRGARRVFEKAARAQSCGFFLGRWARALAAAVFAALLAFGSRSTALAARAALKLVTLGRIMGTAIPQTISLLDHLLYQIVCSIHYRL